MINQQSAASWVAMRESNPIIREGLHAEIEGFSDEDGDFITAPNTILEPTPLDEALKAGAKGALQDKQDSVASVNAKVMKTIQELGEIAVDQRSEARLLTKTGNRFEATPLRSKRCRSLFQDKANEISGRPIGKETLNGLIEALEGQAIKSGKKIRVATRVTHKKEIGSSVIHFINLATESGEIIRVGADGWSVINNVDIPFEPDMGALPSPIRPADLSEARAILVKYLMDAGVDESKCILVIAVLVEYLRDNTAYPILEILGPAGSQKTSLVIKIVAIIDPSLSGKLVSIKIDEEHIRAAVRQIHVIPVDNSGKITPGEQNFLCVVSLGTESTTRKLYETTEIVRQEIHCPIIFTAILPVITAPDLIARSIRINLKSKGVYKSAIYVAEQNLGDAGHAFGALLTLFSAGLEHLDIRKTSKHRMADFALMGDAICTALNYEPDYFSRLLDDAYKSTAQDFCEGDIFIQRFISVCDDVMKSAIEAERFPGWRVWKNNCSAIKRSDGCKQIGITAQALLTELTSAKQVHDLPYTQRIEWFPSNPRALTSKLTLMAPLLKNLGYEIELKPLGTDKRNAWMVTWK